MRFFCFAKDDFHVGRDFEASTLGQHGSILADEILVDHQLFLAVAGRRERLLGQSCDLFSVQLNGLVPCHDLHQLIENGGDGKDFLFPDTKEIVVIGRAGDDGARGIVEIGRFIDNHRGISRPGDDGALRTS